MNIIEDNVADDVDGADMSQSKFGGEDPPMKRVKVIEHGQYHRVAPGTVSYLIEILTLKKNANKVTRDDEEMLKLLENYTNYNYITNFYKKKNKLIYLLDNNTTLYKTPHNLMLITKIKKATAKAQVI